MIRIALAAIAMAVTTGCGTIRFVEDIYATETPAYFAKRVAVVDDPVEDYRYASSKAIARSPPLEVFVYATERAGAVGVTLQIRTVTGQWVYPEVLYFGTPSRSTKLLRVDSDVTCSGSGACKHFERVTAVLGLDDVRALLSEGQAEQIQLRAVGRTGIRVEGYLRKTELAETLRALGALDRFTQP